MELTTNLSPSFVKEQPKELYSHFESNPSWLDTVGATLQYSASPIINRVGSVLQYGRDPKRTGFYGKRDENYNPFDDLGEFEDYSEFLTNNALNEKHMYQLKNQILESKKYRQTLADSSLFAQFTAGFFDPINLIALPFGGPTIGILRSGMRVGAGVGLLSAGQELARAPFDPLNNPIETPLNIGIGIIGGSIMGGITGIIPTRKAKALKRMQQETDSYIANLGGIKAGEYSGPNAIDRTIFSKLSDKELISEKTKLDKIIINLTDEHTKIETSFNQNTELSGIPSKNAISTYDKKLKLEEQLSEAKQNVSPYKIETKLRNIDKALSGEIDFKIDSNILGDGLLYNLVPVPLRQVINSTAGNATKLMTMRLASDNGFGTTLTQMGISLPKGVYELSQMRYGELYSSLAKMTRDWAEHGKRGEAFTKANYNISNFSQRIQNKLNKVDSENVLNISPDKLTLQDYMRGINYHRTNKTPFEDLSKAQRNSVKELNSFYSLYESRLKEVGLLGTNDSIKKDLLIRKKQLTDINKEITLHQKLNPDEINFKSILLKRREQINQEIIDNETSLSFSNELSNTDVEPFNPRFYNKDKIRAKREQFTNLIIDGFKKDPSIFVKRKGKWEKELLPDDEQSLRKRAEKVVSNILNENDVLNLDNTYQGAGVSKHLKHRQISLSNKELYDFLEDDPLKIMRAYVSKTAPAYEFARAFNGKNLDDIRHDIIKDTIKNGGTIEEANKHFMRFGHLHSRIVGTAIRNPDRLSYKFANIIRTAAQLNFLGRAVFSTISEPAKLLHDHAFKDVMKGLLTLVEAGVGKTKATMQADEVMLAGEALDIVLQSTHLRFMDDLKSNPLQNNVWDKVTDTFFTVNGLAPITNIFKQWDGIIRQHTLIDNSIKLIEGKATKQETYFLARYGIDEAMALKIANAPWEQTHRGLYFANTEQWLSAKEFKHISGVHVRHLNSDHPDWPEKSKGKMAVLHRPYKKEKKVIKKNMLEVIDNETGEILDEFDFDLIKIDNVGKQVYDKKTGEVLNKKDYKNVSFSKAKEKIETKIIEEEPIIFLDQELIHSSFDMKPWTKPKMNGVIPLAEDAFKTKDDWFNFVRMHESFHAKHPANDKKFFGRTYNKRIPKEKADYENRINELALKEVNKQTKVQTETLETFRSALNTGVLNTILMGTPADKPILNDGVVYIPYRIAKQFKMKEDDIIKGYSRMENGLLGLPFQFYSYSLAAVTKISGSFLQGQVKNRSSAIAGALILAYMGQKFRTNEYTWDNLSYADKFARSLDYSGLASLHTAILYEAFHTSLALGGNDISGGLLKPKYNVSEDGPVETAIGLSGAGPSIFFDFTRNSFTLATGKEIGYGEAGLELIEGDRGQAAGGILRKMPFMTLPGIYGLSRDTAKAIDNNWD